MAKIKKLRVQEVSLAAFPKNGKKFIIVKDTIKGGYSMNRALNLMAFLSTKAEDVPEVVKEELKNIAKDVSTADVLEVFKELLVDYIVEQKKDGIQIVDTEKYDVLEKDTWIKKPAPEFKLPESVQKELDEAKALASALKQKDFNRDVEAKVGKSLVKDFEPLYGKLADDEINKILDIVKFQQDIIDELGKAQLSSKRNAGTKVADLEAKIAKFAESNRMTMVDAYAAYAKEHPDEIAALEQ